MASHPYISGAGNITQMVGFLRKNFPATVTSETVKKLGLASQNESYVINALQFIGVIDEEGKRTDRGQEVFAIHGEEGFSAAFADLIKAAYKDLFDLRGDDAWSMDRSALIGYFRSADKTSDVIGTRQAGVFQAFRTLAGKDVPGTPSKIVTTQKSVSRPQKARAIKPAEIAGTRVAVADAAIRQNSKKDLALSVRVEINLPAEASAETYDNIFKSIKAHLLNE